VLTNFLNIWVLVRVVQAATAAGLGWLGMVVGLRIALRWRDGQSSEMQLALERQAELAGSVMQVALLLEVLGLALALQVADHLVGGIRGAMCAFGVLASTWAGWPSLWTSVVTAVACAAWVIFHRLDLSLPSPVLTRRKFFALGVIGPLVTADLVLALVFIHSLDFSVIASCCSVWVDDTLVNQQAARWVVSPGWAGRTYATGIPGSTCMARSRRAAKGVARITPGTHGVTRCLIARGPLRTGSHPHQ